MKKPDLEAILAQANIVASGNDSSVYRCGETAVKVFHASSLASVTEYVRILNSCVSLMNNAHYEFQVSILHQQFRACFHGIPVDDVTTSPSERPVTLSEYVAEPNLDWLTSTEDRFAAHPQDSDAVKWQFFRSLNTYFNKESPTRLRDEFEYHLCMLSRILDFHSGTFGLYIGKYNVKLRPNFENNRLALMVTDVAVYISRVIRSDSYGGALALAERRMTQSG